MLSTGDLDAKVLSQVEKRSRQWLANDVSWNATRLFAMSETKECDRAEHERCRPGRSALTQQEDISPGSPIPLYDLHIARFTYALTPSISTFWTVTWIKLNIGTRVCKVQRDTAVRDRRRTVRACKVRFRAVGRRKKERKKKDR